MPLQIDRVAILLAAKERHDRAQLKYHNQKALIEQNVKSIARMTQQDPRIKQMVIERNPRYLMHIENPSTDLMIEAFKKDQRAILYTRITPDLCFQFVQNCLYNSITDIEVARYIFYRSFNGTLTKYLYSKFGEELIEELNNFSTKRQMGKIRSAPSNIVQYIKNQAPDVQWTAVKTAPHSLKGLNNPTKEMIEYAILRSPRELLNVPEQTDELIELAMSKDSFAIQYVTNIKPEMAIKQVQLHGTNRVAYMVMSEETQVALVEKYPTTLLSMKNMCKKLIQLNYERNDLGARCASRMFYSEHASQKVKTYLMLKWGESISPLNAR